MTKMRKLNGTGKPEKNICVFCGSGKGVNPAYEKAAQTLGKGIASAGYGLVYGGGSLGLMGETARAVLGAGGYVTGIIPEFLSDREKMLKDVQELEVVSDMHVRKAMMFEQSSAIVALPGGLGTLEEIVEQLTWSQLGQHTKPIVLANIENFWSPLFGLFEQMRNEKFIREGLEVSFEIVDDASAIVPRIQELHAEPMTAEETRELTEHF